MIKSFGAKDTEKVFNRQRPKNIPPDILERAHNKLMVIHAVEDVNSLAFPPGNRLEKLGGYRQGQYSIRVNEQWRICFRWEDGNAHDVEICDYH